MNTKNKNTRGFISMIFISVFLVGTVLAIGYYVLHNQDSAQIKSPVFQNIQRAITAASPSPTPFPFQEVTIPHLRNRSYESVLGELERYSGNLAFTSYLTSYTSDGLTVNGYLTIPVGDRPADGWPAIVFVHGYIPPNQYRTTQNYASYVNYLATNGFVVFKIDLRGHDKSEGDPGGSYYSADYVIDTLNAHAALKSADFVNPAKIYLWGHSMAGNVVFRSFVASKQVSKIVIWAGAVYTYEDMQEFRIQDNSYQPPPEDSEQSRKRRLLFDTYGSFDPDSDFWKQVPATNYLTQVTGSVQIHHAVDDSVVNIGYSRKLMEILDGTGIDHELVEYSTGGHNLTGVSFTRAMRGTVDFLQD
jgi:dipeptidyl aminopeptidase/acylaminoacyl peptidase